MEINRPSRAAATPLVMDPPLKDPTMASPKIASMNISPDLNAVMIGVMSGKEMARTAAPKTPPKADTVKAAPKARAACPFWAKGYPSKIVA